MYDRFEILYSRLRRLVSRNRWSARLLGHAEPAAEGDHPGLLLIQINGLSVQGFRAALEENRMPFLRQLHGRDHYRIHPLYSGLPSTGAAFQAEFFYGAKASIPGLWFLDPVTGRDLMPSDPRAAAAIEEHLKTAGDGLLRGGSVWAGVFTGGADESHFCAATSGFDRTTLSITPNRVFRLMIWHGWNVLRVAGNLLALIALQVADLVRGRPGMREFFRRFRHLPVRLAVSSILREVAATGAAVDAERGLPVIHLSFLGYDEYAHLRGPDSRFARWSLSGIDRSIRRVWMAAHRSRQRDYQVWIYSPHGQERVDQSAAVWGGNLTHAARSLFFFDRPAPMKPRAHRRLLSRTTLNRLRWLMAKTRGTSANAARPATARASEDVRVIAHGALASVYLPENTSAERAEALARRLVAEHSVPAALVPRGPGQARLFNGGAAWDLPGDAESFLGREHPHSAAVAEDLAALAGHPGAGEVVLLSWSPQAVLSFSGEHGTHGGPGPQETSGFLLLPPEAPAFTHLPGDLRPAALRKVVLDTLGRHPERGSRRNRPAPRSPDELWTPRGIPLRVMTYNVHGCRGMDGQYAPHRIARVIARERPDVVCLQELDQERSRSGGVDQIDVIAKRLQLDYHFHTVAEVDDGRFGNAILSTFPLERVKAQPLPADDRVKDVLQLEDRGALWVRLKVRGEVIHIINTHLSILQRERRRQTEALLGPGLLGSPDCTGSVILAGDFNASPDSWTVRRLETRLRNAVPRSGDDRDLRTWTGRTPLRRIDHIFASDAVLVRRVRVPRSRLSRTASDHLPLVADLLCPVAAPVS